MLGNRICGRGMITTRAITWDRLRDAARLFKMRRGTGFDRRSVGYGDCRSGNRPVLQEMNRTRNEYAPGYETRDDQRRREHEQERSPTQQRRATAPAPRTSGCSFTFPFGHRSARIRNLCQLRALRT